LRDADFGQLEIQRTKSAYPASSEKTLAYHLNAENKNFQENFDAQAEASKQLSHKNLQ